MKCAMSTMKNIAAAAMTLAVMFGCASPLKPLAASAAQNTVSVSADIDEENSYISAQDQMYQKDFLKLINKARAKAGLNSVELVTAFLSAATAQGGVPCDALMTDTKIYVETIMPEPICIPTQRNGTVAIYMGARFSTSDYGDGAVEMRTFLLNGVCLNGMVRESVMKQIHLGARLSESQMLSDRTYRLDTATMVSAIGDYTRNLYDPNNLRQKSLEIQAASEAEVDFEAELKKLVKGGRLQKTEGEGVQKLLMANNPDDGLSGGATLWKLTQAITACARELAPARSRELQEISGELMARAL